MTNQRGVGHHFILPLLAILAVGAIGVYLTFLSKADTLPTPAPKQGFVDDGAYVSKAAVPFSQVRDYMSGGDKNKYAFAITQGSMRHTVLNVGLRELVSVDPTTGKTSYIPGSIESRIQNAVTWNTAHPKQKITVHLRFHVGQTAPEAWKDICGRVTMTDPQFNVTAVVPRWWAKSDDGKRYLYRDLYASAMKVLAPAVSNINKADATQNLIGSVNIPAAAPNYPEPMILYASAPEIRKNLVNAGFTAEEHNKFMLWVPRTAANFKDVAVELALNPYQNIDESTGGATNRDKLLYRDVAEVLISSVGSRAVLANYSARTMFTNKSVDKSDYGQMYDWMIEKTKGLNDSPKVWAGVQMARPQNVASGNKTKDPEQWDNVSLWAANKGFNFAETTGPGSGEAIKRSPANANIWPKSYHDDKNDLSDMRKITKNFLDNSHP